MHVLVAGCGWLGTAIARALVARGDRVTAIRRDAQRAATLAAPGIAPLAVDLAQPGADSALPGDVEAIVACQAASADTQPAYRAAYVEANRTLLALAERARVPLVYTSSTGVFGQRDGSEVAERTTPAPASPTGQILLEAERLVRGAVSRGVRASVVRLSGLYGPDRLGTIERVRSGRLTLGPGDDAWMNFCHRDDAVAFVLAALDRGEGGVAYHGSDAAPARRREVVEWIAARLGIPAPRSTLRLPAPDRRISSVWTRERLGVVLLYPSFYDGFAPWL
ncbi:MAG TPA: NAD-dependent epimerase/dehydratase family protein [Anaeromyxobacteraceae bacterium]|nr:NAD-dependent epimerase/dehydratase family protein [Anaeromyxobacteraceae bacterium]